MMNEKLTRKKNRKPKIVVIGGGTGLPVILAGLRAKNADVTAIVTVADDGGSSGDLRRQVNAVPPGDIRNVLVSLSDIPEMQKEIFQYRFAVEDQSLAGHSIGNLIISAMAEMKGNIYEAIQVLGKMMMIDGHVYPAAEEPLELHAVFKDGTQVSGESSKAEILDICPSPYGYAVFLRSGGKIFVIYVDRARGMALQSAFAGYKAERPLTFEFVAQMLEALECSVKSAVI